MLRRREPSSPPRRMTAAQPQLELSEAVLVRYSRVDDEPALERLAALDSQRLPEGPLLLAELDGELAAAVPLDGEGEPLSDPFRPTAAIRELLRLRRRQIQRSLGAPVAKVPASSLRPLRRLRPAQRSVSSF